MIEWAKSSRQGLVLLQLDFAKTFDMVSWDFLFATMAYMGVPGSFTNIVKMLLQGASTTVSLNSQLTEAFPIKRGVRQGCPLEPYLFLMVAYPLNIAAKAEPGLKDISLPGGPK